MSQELSPEQRNRLRALLLSELRQAWAAARAAGADPASLRQTVAERRNRLRSFAIDEDGQRRLDDPPDRRGVGE